MRGTALALLALVATAQEARSVPTRFLEGALAEWRDVFSGANASLAAPGTGAQTVAAPRAATAGAANRTTSVTTNAPITITGVSDPRAAADHAVNRLRERERAAHDAAHPVRED